MNEQLHPTLEACPATDDPGRPLAELNTGETAVIAHLQGGHTLRSRLASLGFTPGAEIRMLQNLGHGPLLVSLRESRIALGRGEAQKILLE